MMKFYGGEGGPAPGGAGAAPGGGAPGGDDGGPTVEEVD